MKNKFSSFTKVGLRRRLWIAVALTTILPAIMFLYFISNIYIPVIAAVILLFIVILGWLVILEVVFAIRNIHTSSQQTLKEISSQDKISLPSGENEVDNLGEIFDILTSKVKESIEELENLSCKTESLNKDISQKVQLLSTLMQANSLFAKGGRTEEILQFLIERLRVLVRVDKAVCVLFREDGKHFDFSFTAGVEPIVFNELVEDINFKNLLEMKEIYVNDPRQNNEKIDFIMKVLDVAVFVVMPIYLKRHNIGVLILGRVDKDNSFSSGEKEVIDLFARNMSLIREHYRLSKRVQDLEVLDSATGFYNKRFFLQRLNEEIERVANYQRPCGVVALNLSSCSQFRERNHQESEELVKKIGLIIKASLRPIDLIARIEKNILAIILIERNRRQSQKVAEDLKEVIVKNFNQDSQVCSGLAFVVVESPLDGNNANQLCAVMQERFKQ